MQGSVGPANELKSERGGKSKSADRKAVNFASAHSGVKLLAAAIGVLGGLAGLYVSLTYMTRSAKPNIFGVIAMPIVCGLTLGGMTVGIALLFAPSAFYSSDKGKAYLQIIGTQHLAAARIVILISLLLGLVLVMTFALVAWRMAGF